MQLNSMIGRWRYRLQAFARRGRSQTDYLADGTLTMGAYSYGAPHIIKYPGDTGKVIIGKFCSIAHGTSILVGGNHRTDWISTYPFAAKFHLPGMPAVAPGASRGDVVIGSDVWLGLGCRILSGIEIGHGAVVAASAMVTKSVPPYTVVAGNPAVVVKQRFTNDQIAALLDIAWWDWPLERILAHAPHLCHDDVDGFIALARAYA